MYPGSKIKLNDDVLPITKSCDYDAQKRMILVEWMNTIVPHVCLPVKASNGELRASLLDGVILCKILSKLRPNFSFEGVESSKSLERLKKFLATVAEMGLSGFEISDLEKGSMKPVLDCLFALKEKYMPNFVGSKFLCARYNLASEEPQQDLHCGHKFLGVFQTKQGLCSDPPATRFSEMMKSNSLDNAPTQSLLSMVNGILDESIERKNTEIPQRLACLLRKVIQEIERRLSTQAEHLRMQSNHFKSREEKYKSRIRVLEALATGTSEETEIVTNELQRLKVERIKLQGNEIVDKDLYVPLEMKEKDQRDMEIMALKQELETTKKAFDHKCLEMKQEKGDEDKEVAQLRKNKYQMNLEISALRQELEECKKTLENREVAVSKKEHDEAILKVASLQKELEMTKKTCEQRCLDMEQRKDVERHEVSQLLKEKDQSNLVITTLKEELETIKNTYELRCQELEAKAKLVKSQLEHKLKEQEKLLEGSRNKIEEIKANAELNSKTFTKKEHMFQGFINNHSAALQELRSCSKSMKLEQLKEQKSYSQELYRIGEKIKELTAATAQKHHQVLYENRKIYNELQDLKGNIRVYCRIRPFLPGQTKKDTVIDSIGDNGELTIVNPSKGKDTQKSFKFSKVFGPASTQGEVFTDTQPLIRTILDGYNVCIFAYGQTGSGKTYTMMGPEGATKENWGVNYRALDDLFQISKERKSHFVYEIGVQMVEIYNEQILDLLSSDNSQKKLGVLTGAQPNGIAVPDASMHAVHSTSDVIELMSLGHGNRTVSSTAMNERSSRSHSVVTVHAQGKDLKSGATTHASLHLVDLAGSERVDRSEVTGDRLKEAQHINKSLSALGDVIFALASKSNHVPYRNSKLTQVLQSSLGGRAKTLMFVQVNPDIVSFTETLSTLKFAERVSGVELGAAKSNKEGRDVKELMEQVVSLKDMIAKKDEELQLLKDPRFINSPLHSRHSTNSLNNYGSQSSPSSSIATDQDDSIERNSDSASMQLTDNDERLSEASDGDVLAPTDANATFEAKDTTRGLRQTRNTDVSSDKARTSKPTSPLPKGTTPSRLQQVKTTVKAATALRKAGSGTSSTTTTPKQQASATSSSRPPPKRW